MNLENHAPREEFPLADILTLTTGMMLAEGGCSSLQKMLDYLTRDNIFTHQIPRAATVCAPWVVSQYPNLPNEKDAKDINETNWREWLTEQEKKFGTSLPLEQLPGDDWKHINPIEELVGMVGADKVIAVTPQ